jgi:hypothetical protein
MAFHDAVRFAEKKAEEESKMYLINTGLLVVVDVVLYIIGFRQGHARDWRHE